MTPKFSIGQVLFNRNTHENGTVGKIYELNGLTMYEVLVPVQFRGLATGSSVSDWPEEVLELAQGHSRDRNSSLTYAVTAVKDPGGMTDADLAVDKLQRIQQLWKELGPTRSDAAEYKTLLEQIRVLSAEYQALVEATKPRK